MFVCVCHERNAWKIEPCLEGPGCCSFGAWVYMDPGVLVMDKFNSYGLHVCVIKIRLGVSLNMFQHFCSCPVVFLLLVNYICLLTTGGEGGSISSSLLTVYAEPDVVSPLS